MTNKGRSFSDHQILDILSLSSNATAVYTTESIIIEMANDAMLHFWGKDRSAIGKSLEEAVPELKGQPFIGLLQNVWRTGVTYNAKEMAAELKVDGVLQTFYFDFEYRAIKKEDDSVYCILHTATDVTARVMNRELREQAIKLHETLLREKTLNEELAALNEELTATNEELHAAQSNLSILNAELEDRITYRTQQLATSEARLREVFQQAPLAFCILSGRDLIVELANERMIKLWNKGPDVIGLPHEAVRPSSHAVPTLARLVDVWEKGIPFTAHEVKAYLPNEKNHEYGYFNIIYQPVKNENGVTTSILIMVDDVTEVVFGRIENEQVNRQLRLAVDAAKLGTWYFNPDTKALEYDATLASIYGYQKDEKMTYGQVFSLLSDEDRKEERRKVKEVIANGGDYETVYKQKRFNDNQIIWVRVLGKLIREEEENRMSFSGVVMDITDQVKGIQAIAESEERFRTMAEGTDLLISVADEWGKAVYFNKAWTEYTGMSVEELLAFGWMNVLHEEDRENYLQTYLTAFEKKEAFRDQFRLTDKQGGYRWWLAKGFPRFHKDGSFAGYISSAVDITEQKQDEQRKNDFIGMVSHELKTPLTSMSGYLQILASRAKNSKDDFAAVMLDKANKQVKKMTSMVNSFLNVSRLEAAKIQIDKFSFDMADLMKEAEEETASTISSHTIVFNPVQPAKVNADREKIGQVINNLISNAVKYSAVDSTIQIACVAVNDYVQVSIRDAGIGIQPQDMDKLFERYYRVKDNATKSIAGFGIGLYLCAEIIQRHDGTIWVESEWGTGSTFYFTLPLDK